MTISTHIINAAMEIVHKRKWEAGHIGSFKHT